MSKRDSQFVNVFSVVLAILVVIAILLIAFARIIEKEAGEPRQAADPILRRAVAERIRPFGQVAVAGRDNTTLAIAPPPGAPAEPAGTASLPADGEATYQAVCSVCHGAGIGGAPATGDKAAWAPRLAQGLDVLHKHSIEGFQGQAGVMPARGGRPDLTDDLVIQAVDYMVEQVR